MKSLWYAHDGGCFPNRRHPPRSELLSAPVDTSEQSKQLDTSSTRLFSAAAAATEAATDAATAAAAAAAATTDRVLLQCVQESASEGYWFY